MNRFFFPFLLCLVWSSVTLAAVPPEWQTRFERSDSTETATYDETVAYCRKLAGAVPDLEYRSFGTSPEDRELPVLLWGQNQNAPLVLVIAGIHAGEIDGKDAGLLLLRDALVLKEYPGLLDGVRLAFVPIFSVDGHERRSRFARANQIGPVETGWRTTAQNLNLNRDFMKADAPEMRALLGLIRELEPDFLVDIHVTDGADYQYTITQSLNRHADAPPPIRQYNMERFLPALQTRMKALGWELPNYVSFRDWRNMESGWESGIAPPRFSHGYGTVINRPALLIETHSLKPYAQRVRATYDLLRALLATVSEQAAELKAANHAADSLAAHLAGKPCHLDWELTSDSVMVEFAGVEFHREWSSVLGDSVIRWGTAPRTYRIPFFSTSVPMDTMIVPFAYLIPPAWLPLVREVLEAHGVPVRELRAGPVVPVQGYRLTDVSFRSTPYESRQLPSFQAMPFDTQVVVAGGMALVRLDHPRAQVAIHLLEPRGPDSFVKWGCFNQIFEQKEYAEAYVMDSIATRMLAEHPALSAEFEQKLADSTFAASPDARLQFFYERSPYWDQRKNLYPIYRVTDEAVFHRLMLETSGGAR